MSSVANYRWPFIGQIHKSFSCKYFFVLKMSALRLLHIFKFFQTRFVMEVNTMNPDQIAPRLGPNCLQYKLPKNIC